ncbi:MAG: outer membrane lipoprotein-sorting protein [Longimicrobiales bacterium]
MMHRDRGGVWVALAALVGVFFLSAPAPVAGQTDPRILEIIDQVDRILRGESSQASIRMEIETEHWSRSLEMEAWSLGVDYSLIRVGAPVREAGTATLKVDDEVWNYLPRVDRTIKVPPSMMVGSWMGSHFTNDDLVKESRIIEDYDITMGFEGDREGDEVWEFLMTPKPEAPVIWGRIEQRIRKADRMPLWARYYDEDGTLVRTMTFTDFQQMGGRLVPTVMTVEPEDMEERTVVTYLDLSFDIDLDEGFFSLRNLKAR